MTKRVKSAIEVELYAAKRVGQVLAGLSFQARGRVLQLVAEHNEEERMAPATTPLFVEGTL
jgi:hypothetical protein